MKKMFHILAGLALLTGVAAQSFADKASDAYVKALERGDTAAAYRAGSYLAPPYCYDLNRWHGVKFTKAVNGRVVAPAYPFTYQDMAHLKVRMLYERAGISEMEKKSRNELDLIRHISDWANMQWGHTQPLPYASWDAHEILDRVGKGDAFWCTFKAVLFVQACNAAGLTARMLAINRKDQDGHTVTEVYNNDFRKWMLVDPWMNCYFERNGVPLSALEYRKSIDNPAGIYLVFGENGKGTEYWSWKTGKSDTIPNAGKRVPIEQEERKGLIEYYYDTRIVLRNDTTVHPQPKENIYVDGFMVPYNSRGDEWWGPQLKWSDDSSFPQITCDNTNEINDFEWPLNEVKVDLRKITVPGESVVLSAHFTTLTPSFTSYCLEIDGMVVPVVGDVFVWKLKTGKNSLTVATVNAAGRRGFQSEFELEYDPSLVDYSRVVTVGLENPGFEEANPKSGSDRLIPLKWGTICSNPLQYGEFSLDSAVKHSGKYSLKASPARDPKTNTEYAFIVRTDPFDVNPASDVAYTIWLRASDDNTLVDICLLDSTYKGQGTYVKRVIVGKQWKKYDLQCRLNSEITKAYIGFKVYTGTVWADDANLIEAK